MTSAMAGVAEPGRLYRRLWRWHFYAAFLVIPFVLLQSTTGTLYLWQEEWADAAHPALRFVAPRAGSASVEAQVASARAALPHAPAGTLILPADPRRATQVIFGPGHHGEGAALPSAVFVDPHDARVLGSVRDWRWMPGWTRRVHGGWPLGDAGSWLLELGACWAVVMILSGFYLWWAGGEARRREGGVLAALLPRRRQGLRTLLRDLHASAAAIFAGALLLFLLSALPWTAFWGERVLKPVQRALGQPSPFADVLRARSAPFEADAAMSLDEAVQRARALGLDGDLEIKLDGAPGSALVLRNRRPRTADETALAFDRGTRELRVRTTWSDYPAIPRAVATGVDLHEGRFFGRANQWFNTALSLGLVWISITGLAGAWLRRPRGARLPSAPPRSAVALGRGGRIAAVLLCLAMPLLGLSVLLLWLADSAWLRLRAGVSARG